MKKNNNILIILLIVFIFSTLVLGSLLTTRTCNCESNITECKCEKCPACKCEKCPETNTCSKSVPGEQMLYADMGTIYVSKTGEVYFDPSKSAEFFEEKIDISKYAKTLLGEPKSNTVTSNKFFEGKHTFSYKLDLTDVRSADEFHFGNGGSNFTIIFIHNNGSVSELSYGEESLKLFKNISGYSDIVSVSEDDDEDGHSAKLYDKCGNGIKYTSQRYK